MRSCCSRKGLSLAEVVLTSFLVFMVLGVIAALVRQYREVSTHTRLQDASLRSALALQQAAAEVKEALVVITPPPGVGGSYASLEFDRLDPNDATRFPSPIPTPATFDPRTPLMRVQYTVDAGELVRLVQVGATVSRQLIAENAVGFTAENQGTAIKLSLRVQEEKRQTVYEALTVVTP